jgi:hypothetical protein
MLIPELNMFSGYSMHSSHNIFFWSIIFLKHCNVILAETNILKLYIMTTMYNV